MIIRTSCLGDFGWPKVGDFEVANGVLEVGAWRNGQVIFQLLLVAVVVHVDT